MKRIGIVGASGAVGSSLVRHLRRNHGVALRLGARRIAGLGDDAIAVDVSDAASLRRFCDGCDVVVNTAGPTTTVLDKIARAAYAAGAGYVDAAGDEPVHDLLHDLHDGDHPVVLSAGMMPGLTALLPRYAVTRLPDATDLTAYTGGLDHFTETAAGDYVASLRNGYGTASGQWRDRPVARALSVQQDVEIAFFPTRVNAIPYLSQENVRIAARLKLRTGSWFNVFAGRHIFDAFAQVQDLASTDPDAAISALCAAAKLDLSGRRTYQIMTCQVDNKIMRHTVILHADNSYALSGAFAAWTALEVCAGRVPRGVHFAGEILQPEPAIEYLQRSTATRALQSIETALHDTADFQEGAL